MPFGVGSLVGRGIGVLDGGGDHRRERGSFGGKCGHPIVTNGVPGSRFQKGQGISFVALWTSTAMLVHQSFPVKFQLSLDT